MEASVVPAVRPCRSGCGSGCLPRGTWARVSRWAGPLRRLLGCARYAPLSGMVRRWGPEVALCQRVK